MTDTLFAKHTVTIGGKRLVPGDPVDPDLISDMRRKRLIDKGRIGADSAPVNRAEASGRDDLPDNGGSK